MHRVRATAVAVCFASVLPISSCGQEAKTEPTQRDATAITQSVNGIVEQCGLAESGFVTGVDRKVLARDVDELARVAGRVRPDAEFRIEGLPPELATTTLARQLRLAERKLDTCAPDLAGRLRTQVAE